MKSVIKLTLTLSVLSMLPLVGLAGCGEPSPAPPPAEPTEQAEQAEQAPMTPTAGTETVTSTLAPERDVFAPDQILVIGVAASTTLCVDTALGYSTEVISQTSLAELLSHVSPTDTQLIFTSEQRPTVVFETRSLPEGADVLEAVELINRVPFTSCPIRAEPNYVVGYPWTLKPVSMPTGEGPEDQFAWPVKELPGINLEAYLSAGGKRKGTGVDVAIFDNAPPGAPSPITVPALPARPPWTVAVTSYSPLPAPGAFGATIDAPSHGFFVASLVNQVAPGANLEIHEVLNRTAEGYVGTLANAINAFATAGHPNGAVINLSLGIPIIPGFPSYLIDTEIIAANAAGIPVIASAGNDGTGGGPGPIAYPADRADVIGVAGYEGRLVAGEPPRGCYSNQGDFAGPGGQSIPPPPPGAGPCNTLVNPADTCQVPGREGNCVVGVTMTVGAGAASLFENAFWAGTSFSAPYLSGLMALMYEEYLVKGNPPGSVAPPALTTALGTNPQATPLYGTIPDAVEAIGAIP